MAKKHKQIFYDKKNIRLKYSKWGAIGFFALFLFVFGIALSSVAVHHPVLPEIDLIQPQAGYRGSPSADEVQNEIPRAQQAFDFDVSQNIFKGISTNANRKMIGFYVNWDDSSLTSLKSNVSYLDEIMPEWYHLGNTAGEVVVNDQKRQDLTMDFIESDKSNLAIVPVVNNFNQQTKQWDQDRLSQNLASQETRTLLTENLKNIVQENNFNGISIDFEKVPEDQQENLVLFMQELYGMFHPLGLEVSQNVPIDDDSFDLEKLAENADFLVLMAYDEHTIHESTAGPIASQNWFSQKLSKRLESVPAEKMVVAVGGYGYDWIDEKNDGSEISFQEAIRIARESGAAIKLDSQSLNPTFDYYDEKNILHHVWFLDGATVFNQMQSANQLGNIKGYALWRLGSEDPSLWNIFNKKSFLNFDSAKSLEKLKYGYDVSYKGNGEVMLVLESPNEGARELFYDVKSGLITEEKIIKFPSSYEINRWGQADKKIAITFDDGPDSEYTNKILDILKQHNVKATFFVVGAKANSNQEILKRINKEEHEIGNHTYTHPDISSISSEQFRLELDSTERLLEGVLGRKSLLFRPTYSRDIEPETPEQMQPLILTRKLGYYTVGMHIDANDWARPGTDQIVNAVVSGAKNGDGNVVLMHDAGGKRQQTIEALPIIIEQLKSEGFQFVGVSELVGLRRDDVMPKVSQTEMFMMRINNAAFTTASIFNKFIYVMFFAGIILGILRLIFVFIFSIIQWHRSRKLNFSSDYRPNVDIIIPAYNEEMVICRTIKAILNSTYRNYRIIVVDDGSQDRTYEFAQRDFGNNSKVKIYTKENTGKSGTLNFGISKSNGEIIITLDADTLFRSDTMEKLIRRFANQNIAAVAGNAKVGNRINILTRWQALEYITSQNFDRRAFDVLNCISVVPGAVGAWRRDALLEAGGFSDSTLAEDADLTFGILKNGHYVEYEDEAIGFTEAPDNVKNFLKQRFRWMFGMLQTAWKYRTILFRPRYGALGWLAIPNLLIFQIFFPLIAPLMDLMLLVSILSAFWQKYNNQIDFSSTQSFRQILIFYLLFAVVDLLAAAVSFFLERKEDWRLLFWLPFQRFFYRQLIYYVAFKVMIIATIGRFVGWDKVERTNTVKESVKVEYEI